MDMNTEDFNTMRSMLSEIEMKITHSAKEGDFQTFENYMATQTTADIICGTTY